MNQPTCRSLVRLAGLFNRRCRALLTALLLAAVASVTASAQKDTGAIAGLVKDSSNAVVEGAKVTVTDVDRGTKVVTQTNAQGEYLASPLKVGSYSVTIEKVGFKKAVAGPIKVDVQERPAVDVTLQVGTISESMTITSISPQLETETSGLGQVQDSHTIETLPLNGRNYAQLALLGAGVGPAEPGSRVETSYGFSSNGSRSLQNNFQLDGVDNNSDLGDVLNGSAYVIQPSVDAIAEFKVETNSYSAEFGRGNGAVMNAVIKSGTNDFHGDAYEFLRNDKLDARNAFDVFGRQPYQQNQFGATLGGPIIKNKLFFFGDYEGLRIRQALPQLSLVPTPAEISGDFSSFLTTTPAMAVDANGQSTKQVARDCSGNPTYMGEIFNTYQTQASALNPDGVCGVPIGVGPGGAPTNIFPKGLIDPLAARLSALFPAPNANLNGSNYLAEPKRTESQNNFDIRIDQTFSDRDSLFGRFSYESQPSFIPSPFNNALDGGAFQDGYQDDSYRSAAISETHTFSQTMVNEFRIGYNRINSHRFQLNYNTNVAAQLGFPGVPPGLNNGGLPTMTIDDGTAEIGSFGYLPSIEKQNAYVLDENLSKVHGRHSLKFGTELRVIEFTIFQPAQSRGSMDFASTSTDNAAAPATGGEAYASFLLGLTDGATITNQHNVDYHRGDYSWFAQDDIRATRKLTLNLGLRYELFTVVKARFNELANFDFANDSLVVPKGQTAQLTPTIASYLPILRTGTPGLISPDLHNFAPRVGLAYQIADKLVFRAGYGIFYGGEENGPYSNPSPGFNPPFFITENFISPCSAPTANASAGDCRVSQIPALAGGFPANSLVDPNTPIFFSVDKNLRTPYMQQWHLSIERQLPADSVFTLTYAGSKGTKLYTFFNGNQAAPDPNPNDATAPRRPVSATLIGATSPCSLANPENCTPVFDTGIDWFRSTGSSNYNSLQASFEKRFAKGLQFQASYTYAHSLDIASNANLGPTQNNSDFRYFRDPQAK